MFFRSLFFLRVILVLIFSSILYAQPLSEPLEKWQFETGYSHYWHKGEFYWSGIDHASDNGWSNGTFYLRSGLFDKITLSFEAMAWPVNSPSNYPGESFVNFNIGFGLSSPSIEILIFNIFFNIHYLENFYLDQSEDESDKRFRFAQIGVPFRIQIRKHFTLWFAPLYIWRESVYFEDQNRINSSQLSGISVGLDVFLFKHIYLNIRTTYSEYFYPGITAGYRF